jgi:hypothetical protein
MGAEPFGDETGSQPMGKFLMIVGLIVIGVVAGFVVRLLIPGSRLSSGS